jgi:hypothetical protein
VIEERSSDELLGSAYASWAIARFVVASASYDLEDREFDTTAVTPTGVFQDRVQTERLRPELRFFTPRGFFARARGTRYDQEVDQFDDHERRARR